MVAGERRMGSVEWVSVFYWHGMICCLRLLFWRDILYLLQIH